MKIVVLSILVINVAYIFVCVKFLVPHQCSVVYVRRPWYGLGRIYYYFTPRYGHGIGCLWLLLLPPKTEGDLVVYSQTLYVSFQNRFEAGNEVSRLQ